MADKYMERENLNNTLDELCVNDSLYNALQIIPDADVQEVVRCKDCEYHNDCSIEFTGMFGLNSFCCLGKKEKEREQE